MAYPAGISGREAEVLEAIGRHLTNAQIASRMHLSVRTVESHVSSLLRKFGVTDRRALADLAPAVTERQPAGPAEGPVRGLPPARTTFVGRQKELDAVLAALADSRVVTLVGPGGVGKTRLAVAAAEAAAPGYTFGSVFADLVPVRDGFLVQAVAALLGVKEGQGRSLDVALHEHLARGRSLLVLDNCEHLLDVVAVFVEKLLIDCPGLRVLATSRERLAIPGERLVVVPPLSLAADAAGSGAGSEAVTLFTQRATEVDPEFAASPDVIAQVCARLDGMPLAIELAAARSASLGMEGLLAGLDDHLRLLTGSRGAQQRHRSLRAVIDWSYDMLDEEERVTFRRLGAFAGSFDLAAAAAVCGSGSPGMIADLVGRLAGKSLLAPVRGPQGSRWRMLATIRAYALERLADSGEEAAVRDARLAWAVDTAAGLEHRAETGHGATEHGATEHGAASHAATSHDATNHGATRHGPDEAEPWQAVFDAVAADMRAALDRTPQAPHEAGHRLARSLGHLAFARRFLLEARRHYQAAAVRAAGPAQAAADLRSAADVALAEGRGAVAYELLLESGRLAAEADDTPARAMALAHAATIADRFVAEFPAEVPHETLRGLVEEAEAACPGDPVCTAYVRIAQAWTALPEKTVPDPVLAARALAAARRTRDPVLISGALDAVVMGLDAGGRLREAHESNKERAGLLGLMPRHDPRAGGEILDIFHMVTEIAVAAGDLPAALRSARLAEGDDLAGGLVYGVSKPIVPLVLLGRFDEALAQAAQMWQAWNEEGRQPARHLCPAGYAALLALGLRGDTGGWQQWLARLTALNGGDDDLASGNLAPIAAFTRARVDLHRGATGAAVAAAAALPVGEQPWYESPHWYSLRSYAWAIAAEVAVAAGQQDAAERLAAAAPAGAENDWAAACLDRAAGRLGDKDALERSVAGWERIDAAFERACTLMLVEGRADEGRAELSALRCPPPA